mgnify:CR=1 FL=1
MKVIVLTSKMSNAVLTEENSRVVSIITCNKDINSKLEKSIKEYYNNVEHVKVIDNNEVLTSSHPYKSKSSVVSFKAEIKTTRGETWVKDFGIEIVATY